MVKKQYQEGIAAVEGKLLRQMAEDAFKALESSIALNKAYESRIENLETALAAYKGMWQFKFSGWGEQETK